MIRRLQKTFKLKTMKKTTIILALILLATSCSLPKRLTEGELKALEAYGRAEHRELTYVDRIYYVDSTSVWVPCGQGWYCRSREIEKHIKAK